MIERDGMIDGSRIRMRMGGLDGPPSNGSLASTVDGRSWMGFNGHWVSPDEWLARMTKDRSCPAAAVQATRLVSKHPGIGDQVCLGDAPSTALHDAVRLVSEDEHNQLRGAYERMKRKLESVEQHRDELAEELMNAGAKYLLAKRLLGKVSRFWTSRKTMQQIKDLLSK